MKHLYKEYIKDRHYYLLSLLFIVFFADLFLLLYGAEANALAYLNISLLIFIAVMTALDYWRYRRLFRALVDFRKEPLIKDIVDDRQNLLKAYAVIIDDLKQIIKNSDEANEKKMREMIDYYTLWVHQIKTPIAAMQLLLDESGDLELKSELIKIEQYVTMVLGYLRINAETTDFVFSHVDLDKLIGEVVKEFAPVFISKHLRIEVAKTGYHFLTDEKWLAFVLGQIISNALKYTKNGSIRIYKQDHYLVVADSGIGIDPKDLPRVFEKGYSGSEGRIDKRASGIGLYLAKKILLELGSDIFIDSKLGEYTRVYIDISDRNMMIE